MKLVDEKAMILVGNLLDAGREFLQGRVVSPRLEEWMLLRVLDRLRRNPSNPHFGVSRLIGYSLEPVHIGLVQIVLEGAIATVVHAKIDGERRWFVQQHIAFEPGVA